MTTHMTNLDCDAFAESLGEYLEGDAADVVRTAVETHAGTCAECAALLGDLSGIRANAAALPGLAPSRDLWDGIAARIDSPVIPMSAPGTRQVARRTWLRPALAAAGLVAVTAGITNIITRASLSGSVPAQQVAAVTPAVTQPAPATVAVDSSAQITTSSVGTPEPVAASSRGTVASAVRAAPGSPVARLATNRFIDSGEPVLVREIRGLRRIVNERRGDLDPRTLAVLEQSMAVIDSAIAQSRAALEKDPASAFLMTQLNRSLETKVELLRTATLLPAGT